MKNNRVHLLTKVYLHTKFEVHASLLLEISCLQGFETLITVDLKCHLTSMENNRNHLLTKGYLHTKFEVHATFPSSDTMFPDFDLK